MNALCKRNMGLAVGKEGTKHVISNFRRIVAMKIAKENVKRGNMKLEYEILGEESMGFKSGVCMCESDCSL